ncbi:MAG: Rpn family recombination-promoting nuclease/putative transposase [Haliscomenobacter sp.]|uniref:Rpn family recombination-promoting nuclease/putative transposase n=1 Tax=Haliscomenobacter sp. TaxID=2717303 RepID=UPI0029B2B09B|nr:Rpn family recombination-promoting nuclease/putative transposase [Haliscomenobacter sp.]MDX2071659.1 Rpn family recombination-promoting nuclease/putative transposase [Haliscomenobacter sp.]
MAKKLVRFDWAMKKMLRNKANFGILEGFLSELLGEEIKIKQILDSESNKESEDDKFNRVDVLVENAKGELVIIEVQNSKEYDYFHRMLYGTSKAITEHIKEGQPYADVKKVISITIAYFDLGQGKDYVYHGKTTFKGIHKNDILTLADKQMELYRKSHIHEIFPEYYVIKVGKFSNRVNDKLDEWIYFFKNAEIKTDFSAKGLKEASERLDEMKLNEKDAKEYKKYLKNLRDLASDQHTKMADAQDLIKKGKIEVAQNLKSMGLSNLDIKQATGLSDEEIEKL